MDMPENVFIQQDEMGNVPKDKMLMLRPELRVNP